MKSLKNRTLGLRRAAILSGLLAFAGNLAAFEPDPARYQDYHTEGIAAPSV